MIPLIFNELLSFTKLYCITYYTLSIYSIYEYAYTLCICICVCTLVHICIYIYIQRCVCVYIHIIYYTLYILNEGYTPYIVIFDICICIYIYIVYTRHSS